MTSSLKSTLPAQGAGNLQALASGSLEDVPASQQPERSFPQARPQLRESGNRWKHLQCICRLDNPDLHSVLKSKQQLKTSQRCLQ